MGHPAMSAQQKRDALRVPQGLKPQFLIVPRNADLKVGTTLTDNRQLTTATSRARRP